MWQVPGHLPPADPELEDGCGPRQEGDRPHLGHQPRVRLPLGNIRKGELHTSAANRLIGEVVQSRRRPH